MIINHCIISSMSIIPSIIIIYITSIKIISNIINS